MFSWVTKTSRKLTYLENKAILGLKVEVSDGTFDLTFKLKISLSRYIQGWEEVTNETHEDRVVVRDNLRYVEVTQRAHEHLLWKTTKIDIIKELQMEMYTVGHVNKYKM